MVAGATVQRPEYLSMNLNKCANLGLNAFFQAERGILKMRQLSVMAQNRLSDVVYCLAEPVVAQKCLRAYMSDIKESAEECYITSKEIDDDFTAWLRFAQELNTAWAEQRSTVADKSVASELKKATEECCLTQTEEAVKVAKKIAEDLGKTLDGATVTYTKTSDNFPTGWEIIGQQVVSGLSECLTTALNQAIPALVDSLDPITKAKAALGGGQTTQPPAVEARDPAYAQLARDPYLFDALNGILRSTGGVDWKSTEVTKEQPKTVIGFISSMLGDSLTSFSKLASDQAASIQYEQILADAVKIAQEILYESKKASSSLSYQKPGKDDPMVKKWQEVFEALYSDTYALKTKGRQLPGNSANPSPLYPSEADRTAQISAKTQQAQLLVDSATKQLTTASETLKVTTEAYKEASKQLLEQQTVLASIKAELTKLTKENMALEEIKTVLVQCIKLIINLKSQITNLVRFFSAIATTIDVFVNKTVAKFLKTVSIAVSSDSVALEKGTVGNYSLLDTERSKREEILNGMYERNNDVSSTIKQLPAGTVPSQIQSVIEKTAKEFEEATKQQIVTAAQYKPINRPSLISLRTESL
ncbi:hypothetical protein J7337_003491 [Fusarium musae]|uniref:Uncharacterized protein n=1 Tax=Fusarium musae TaxID=1042133 RepID=A0A9P8IS71_9HYPO|nr:hypothetical protein J7337_003491 [Fusarium musae]KAG9503540.1 hypothetical protein J7337_003491 [Fusarium musae]